LYFYVNYGIIILATFLIYLTRNWVKNFNKGGKSMLYSLAIGFATYGLMVFVIGLFATMAPVMETCLVFGIICLIGGYLARNYRPVSRIAYLLGGFCIALFAITEFILPTLQGQKSVLIAIAILFGALVYAVTRIFTFRRYIGRRVNGRFVRPAPPYGREWLRWLFTFVM